MLTELPAPGTVVTPGQVLYRVNNVPVLMMRGALPAWRDFTSGMEDGPDVRQLEQNLADLGFFDGTIDDEFTWATSQAIRAWQKANGLEESGVIPRGGIVFSDSDVRVGDEKASIGTEVTPGAPLYTASSSTPIVSANVPVADREQLAVGGAVTIGLPDGVTAAGKIATVDSPREKKDESTGSTKLVIPITVTADDPAAIASLVPLSAQLTLAHHSEDSVLQVPVAALVSLGDGAFGVEVEKNTKITRVPVEVGRYSGGYVEITGGGLKAGDDVVVPE
ncbi:peptidoglycan-binding protein [Microbacterium sp. GXS0129]|uniref:peptidoglycan-binding protein n=1 Tax=Microbacterium sp. GXS0129 TaxID=3377836 RepID=UPI00383ACB3B